MVRLHCADVSKRPKFLGNDIVFCSMHLLQGGELSLKGGLHGAEVSKSLVLLVKNIIFYGLCLLQGGELSLEGGLHGAEVSMALVQLPSLAHKLPHVVNANHDYTNDTSSTLSSPALMIVLQTAPHESRSSAINK